MAEPLGFSKMSLQIRLFCEQALNRTGIFSHGKAPPMMHLLRNAETMTLMLRRSEGFRIQPAFRVHETWALAC